MLNLYTYEDVAVLDLKGELGPCEFERIGQAISSLLRQRTTKMVLNFEHVNHIHYPSMAPLAETITKVKRNHGDLKFAAMNDYTKRIFCFVGLQDVVENFDTVPEAVLSFRSDWRTWH